MYGYIKPQTSELKVREHIFYRSIYCGLCRSLSKHTGGFSSITLSYDMTFFAIIRMILKNEKPTLKKKRCILHPFSKHPIAIDSKELTYSSYVSSVLAHEKVKDNINDDGFFKRLISYIIYPFTATFKNRNKIKFINETSNKYLSRIYSLEKECCNNPDELADNFGILLGELLMYELEGNKAKIAYNIGLHLGRYVYLSDAICDYKEDVKHKKYNPYIYSFDNEEKKQEFLTNGYKIILQREISELINALNLICDNEIDELNVCAYNIVKLGMKYNLELILNKDKGEKGNGNKSIQSVRD